MKKGDMPKSMRLAISEMNNSLAEEVTRDDHIGYAVAAKCVYYPEYVLGYIKLMAVKANLTDMVATMCIDNVIRCDDSTDYIGLIRTAIRCGCTGAAGVIISKVSLSDADIKGLILNARIANNHTVVELLRGRLPCSAAVVPDVDGRASEPLKVADLIEPSVSLARVDTLKILVRCGFINVHNVLALLKLAADRDVSESAACLLTVHGITFDTVRAARRYSEKVDARACYKLFGNALAGMHSAIPTEINTSAMTALGDDINLTRVREIVDSEDVTPEHIEELLSIAVRGDNVDMVRCLAESKHSTPGMLVNASKYARQLGHSVSVNVLVTSISYYGDRT